MASGRQNIFKNYFFLMVFFCFAPGVMAQQLVAPEPEPYERPFDVNRGVLSYAPIMEEALKSVVKLYRMEYSDKAKRYVVTSTGSGVVMDRERGLVITNEHVTDKAKAMVVEFDSNEWASAEVVGESTLVDIAVVKVIDYKPPSEAVFVDTNTVQVGDLAFAAGYPKDLKKTLTTGIVSGMERRGLGGKKGSRPGRPRIEDFIQTDAAINSGNSGGALLDSKGRVLGINTFIYSETEGLGFAVPSNVAIKVAKRLIAKTGETPGYFGATIEDIDVSDQERLGVDVTQGVVLEEVEEGSPAHQAGLKIDDVVVGAGNRSIADVYQFANYVLLSDPGIPYQIYYRRGAQKRVATVTLRGKGESSSARSDASQGSVRTKDKKKSQELHGATLLETISGGWLVTAVASGSLAQRKGLQTGDRIVGVDGRSTRHIKGFKEAVEKMQKTTAGLSIERNGQRFTIIM